MGAGRGITSRVVKTTTTWWQRRSGEEARLRRLKEALSRARDYASWRSVAADIDALTGASSWRAEDGPSGPQLRADIAQMTALQERGEAHRLVLLLDRSLDAAANVLSDPTLYSTALTGTRHVIEDYLAAVEAAVGWLVETPRLGLGEKRALVRRADRVHGRPALLLSGGATLGFYHMGVVKALWSAGLLPEVMCGASMGAMIASGIASRTEDELAAVFADPGQLRRIGLVWAGLARAAAQGAALKPEEMLRTIHHNVGDWTFGEAHARTGRVLNVSLSPTRPDQSPRLLSHLTAPDALIGTAALASGAVPLLFPAVELTARSPSGETVPYLPGERWMDGSMHGDLPKMRLARLHNINRFIVSQTNPHVLPFLGLRAQRGVLPSATRLVGRYAWGQSQQAFQLAAKLAEPTPLRGWADLAVHVTRQEWRGDIDIHPRLRWRLYRRVFANPTLEELEMFILDGERATWPRLAAVRHQTRLSRLLQRAGRQLDAQPAAAAHIRAVTP